jgi:hypothetical protein
LEVALLKYQISIKEKLENLLDGKIIPTPWHYKAMEKTNYLVNILFRL